LAAIDRDGVQVRYETYGEGGGVPVLLTHGFAATRRSLASTVGALAPGRRVVSWDVRGHGESDSPADPGLYSLDLTLGDMLAILDAEDIERAALLGHSMGGYLSLELQRRHPDRVAALVLVGTGPGYRRDAARDEWNRMCDSYARALETKGLDGLPAGSDEVTASAHRGAEGLVRAARGFLQQHDAAVVEHLPAIDVPTLVVVGERDRQFLAAASYMASKIPGARHVVIAGAGHAPMITHTLQLATEVVAFLDTVDRSP